ncbi:hypothetical protein [uncultured Aquimarina sp.]|uniref:hypothetical protein n=1 Tax=uncultured Aquimarina sp. TaxID=575652 RepID=UPI00260FD959|nr:hypothetical protein [uncultured Aquimarina sp.]
MGSIDSTFWNKKNLIYFFITCVFFTLSLIGILHHELWLDESHHWLLARDSTSIIDLIDNTKYEGHPILWNMLLFFISKFSLNPFWMQLLHIIISSILVLVFLTKSPFTLLFKVLFIFGYFIFFEYTLLSRNYNLGILFLFLALSIYRYRKEKILLFSILLAIASNTHAIFVIITTCIMFIVCLEYIKKTKPYISTKMIFGVSIFAIGILLAIIQIIPPSDTSFFERAEDFSLFQKVTRSFITFFKGIFTIPDFRTIHFWNSHFIVNISKPLSSVLGILSIFFPLFIFYKNKMTLLYVYLGILGTSLFFFITQLSAPRYFGLNFLFIITGLWMENDYPLKKNIFNSWFSLLTHKKIKNILIYSILIIQMFSGIVSYSFDLLLPFSSSKQTVEFLQESKLTDKIVITQWCEGTPLSSYLETPLFFTNTNSFQSYCTWNRGNSTISNSKTELVNSLENIINNAGQSAIFISIAAIPIEEYKAISNNLKYKFLKSFTKNIVSKESYYIYEISKI